MSIKKIQERPTLLLLQFSKSLLEVCISPMAPRGTHILLIPFAKNVDGIPVFKVVGVKISRIIIYQVINKKKGLVKTRSPFLSIGSFFSLKHLEFAAVT